MSPKCTGKYMYYADCQWCRGAGRVPRTLDGWYIDYHFQDGHETCGPYSEEEAIWRYLAGRSGEATLVGPDGMVYTVEDE